MFKHAGEKFNRWEVVKPDPDRKRYWICRCECGTVKSVYATNVTRGQSLSCGCYSVERQRESHVTHGMTGTPEYKSWLHIKERCFNPKDKAYHNYGGRGITMHPAWVDDFQAFYDHIGPRPSPAHTVDRKDNDGNYEPGNIWWATKSQQASNRRQRPRPSGLPEGVTYRPECKVNSYRAQLRFNKVKQKLGHYPTPEAARAAYLEALERLRAGNLPIREDRADVR